MADEPALKPFYSVLVLAFVCSALVAGAAVGLRPLQEENRQLNQKKNILLAAGLYDAARPIDEVYSVIQTRLIDLATGNFVAEEVVAPGDYNQLRAAMSGDMGSALPKDKDLAGIRRLENYSLIYLVGQKGRYDQVILPVRGKGLWSTMFAYVSLDADLSTIRGVSFYDHGETPGLGGEVENEKWQSSWQGKKLFDANDQLAIEVVKGKAPTTGEMAASQIDGLSGATLTAKGVQNLLRFWFGEQGFGPFIENMKKRGGLNG